MFHPDIGTQFSRQQGPVVTRGGGHGAVDKFFGLFKITAAEHGMVSFVIFGVTGAVTKAIGKTMADHGHLSG
jgi:hypothetical protein